MSTNILATIVASKYGEVAERKKQISIAQLEAMPLFAMMPIWRAARTRLTLPL